MYKKVLLKLSGEALSTTGKCLDTNKMKEISREIKKLQDKGTQVGIVCGGGNILRGRFAEELQLDRERVDYIGMTGTIINSLTLCETLRSIGAKAICQSALSMPDVCEDLNVENARKHLDEGNIVIFAGGTGKPGCSTDSAAAMRACDIEAECILIAKNGVDGVYNADPNKDATARKYDILTYKEMLDKNLEVIDLKAAKLCEENSIESFVFDMNVEGNIENAASGSIKGTRIVKE